MGELRLFEVLNAGEMLVDQRRVRERPQMLRWLQLWGVGWQEEQVDMVGHAQSLRRMPSGPIQH